MKHVLIDTNVILDMALMRQPFFRDAAAIFEMIDQKHIKGYVSASAITDIFYLARKEKGHAWTSIFLLDLTDIMEIFGVDKSIIIEALTLGWNDFEDALQTQVAIENDLDAIVTRNQKDFKNSAIKVLAPDELEDWLLNR